MDNYQISHQSHQNLSIVLSSNGKKLAMKTLNRGGRYNSIEEVMKDQEVIFLNKLKHKNIVAYQDIIYNSTERTGAIILPYYEMNLYQLLQNEKKLQDFQQRHIIKQIFETLEYVHSQNIFHRDLHPENIMVSEIEYSSDKKLFEAKLIDFGSSKSKTDSKFTDYVGVRWYRAPELLLRCPSYNESVDIFAMGCIIYEIYHSKPLFPGQSEIDQLKELSVILGTPTENEWQEGLNQANQLGIQLGVHKKSNLKMIFDQMPADMVELCQQCLQWNPSNRITSKQALQHHSLQNVI